MSVHEMLAQGDVQSHLFTNMSVDAIDRFTEFLGDGNPILQVSSEGSYVPISILRPNHTVPVSG